jgi:hypothetical protein
MKKFLFITCTAMVMLSGCAYPRQTNNALVGGKLRTAPKNQYLNEIHIRAVRDFVTRFGDQPDVIWHKSDHHYIAVFIRDSIQTRVIYNQHGNLDYTMRYYEEPKMRRDVRALVKSTYYDYKIFIIQEIQKADDQPVYIVNLQGDTEWLKIKVYNGEMEVMEKFKRGRK